MSREAMLRAFWLDRRWFDAHPDNPRYTRPYLEGEFEEKFDPADEDDRMTAAAVASAEEIEVWLSDAPAKGHQAVRMRRIVGFEYPVFNDGWDEVNWMFLAGAPPDL